MATPKIDDLDNPIWDPEPSCQTSKKVSVAERNGDAHAIPTVFAYRDHVGAGGCWGFGTASNYRQPIARAAFQATVPVSQVLS